MKRAIRVFILMASVVGAFIGATVQPVPAADGEPICTNGTTCHDGK